MFGLSKDSTRKIPPANSPFQIQINQHNIKIISKYIKIPTTVQHIWSPDKKRSQNSKDYGQIAPCQSLSPLALISSWVEQFIVDSSPKLRLQKHCLIIQWTIMVAERLLISLNHKPSDMLICYIHITSSCFFWQKLSLFTVVTSIEASGLPLHCCQAVANRHMTKGTVRPWLLDLQWPLGFDVSRGNTVNKLIDRFFNRALWNMIFLNVIM